MVKKAEVILQYQNLIDQPPVAPAGLYSQACSNDKVTISSWTPVWLQQTKANKERFGSFKDHGIGELWGKHKYQPVIVAGSGPSLKLNAEKLKERGEIPLISCLHNFHYFEDLGVKPDYYVSLDAGPITIEEVYEGGTKKEEEYWSATKEHTLLCYIGTHPELLKKWQGKIIFFNCPVPDETVEKTIDAIEPFNQYVSTGGNVLGACLYIAKGYLGASTIIFVGADFCFSYDHKFHAWNSRYDASIGHCVTLHDVFGNRRLTWQSYANFKSWFDYIALTVPGFYINATEGGCLGSYSSGNLSAFKYMDLDEALRTFHMISHTEAQAKNPEQKQKKILF